MEIRFPPRAGRRPVSPPPRKRRRRTRRPVRPALESLESRLVLNSPTITLNPYNDEFGAQIQTVTQFGNSNRVTLGILDTGASPVTVSADDQASFADPFGNPDPIPVKVPGGASADGIGGSVTGDVSQPVTVLTDGLHAASLSFDFSTFNLSVTASFGPTSARVNGIQTFIGTYDGSPDLPTISGTPIFAGGFNTTSASKLAAKIDLINGVDFYGLGLLEPDVHFVSATSHLTPGVGEQLATLPLVRIGASNVSAPGNDISSYFNYASNTVRLNAGGYSVGNQSFLLDTGSELTVISTAEATALHIDLSKPFDSIDVQGVGGVQTVNGYVIDSLQVGLTGGGTLTFKNVPVFVLDAAPGVVDGILGMNLWDYVDQMLVDPFTPSGTTTVPTVSITWDPNYTGSGGWFGLGGGFLLNSMSSAGRGHPTLHELLGGAARDFQVPAVGQSPAEAVVATAAGVPAAGATAADVPAATAAVAMAGVIPANPAGPAAARLQTADLAMAASGLLAGPASRPASPADPGSAPLRPAAATALTGVVLPARLLPESGGSAELDPMPDDGTDPTDFWTPDPGPGNVPPAPSSAPVGAMWVRGEAALAPTPDLADACFARDGWALSGGEVVPTLLEKSGVPAGAVLAVALGLAAGVRRVPEPAAERRRRVPALRFED